MKTTANEITRLLEDTAGQHIGDIVWPEISEVESNAYSRLAIRQALTDAGLPENLIAEEIGSQGALGRARRDVESYAPSGYSLQTPKKRDRAFHVFRSEGEGHDAKKVTCAVLYVDDHDDLKIEYTAKGDTTTDALCKQVENRFAFHTDHADYRDVHRMVTRAMEFVGGTRLKRGSLYWVPTVGAATIRNFANVLEGIGSCELTALPIYDTAESKAQAARAIASSIDAEIKEVTAQIGKLTAGASNTREGTVQRKRSDLAEIELRVESVRAILGNKAEALSIALASAKLEALNLEHGVTARVASKPKRKRKDVQEVTVVVTDTDTDPEPEQAPAPSPTEALDNLTF